MKVLILSILLLIGSSLGAIVNSYIDESGLPIDHHVGTYLIRDTANVLYRVSYDVKMLGGNLIINLDSWPKIQGVECDVSNIEFVVVFADQGSAYSFNNIMNTKDTKFVTGQKWNCNNTDTGAGILMRRVLASSVNGLRVTLKTGQGYYEESIKDGKVTLEKESEDEYTKKFCFGANTNEDCEAAKEPIPIYQNKYMDLSCKNCFVGTKATIVLELEIGFFKLKNLKAGLTDIKINSGFVLGLDAHVSWNTGYERVYQLVPRTDIVRFWVGPIPIEISFEIPVKLVASASLDAKLSLEAGVLATWDIGDAYLSWTQLEHWKVAMPDPKFSWTPVLKASGDFRAVGEVSLTPQISLNFLRILKMYVNINPSVKLEAEGDLEKREACVDLSCRVLSQTGAEVHINIPLTSIRLDKVFGPKTLFDSGVKNIVHHCIKG